MRDNNYLTIICAFAIIALTLIILPFISFWLAYFGGWITSLVIGDTLANALNALFNTTHFTKDIIPMCAGALGWIGGYFKASRSLNLNKEKN